MSVRHWHRIERLNHDQISRAFGLPVPDDYPKRAPVPRGPEWGQQRATAAEQKALRYLRHVLAQRGPHALPTLDDLADVVQIESPYTRPTALAAARGAARALGVELLSVRPSLDAVATASDVLRAHPGFRVVPHAPAGRGDGALVEDAAPRRGSMRAASAAYAALEDDLHRAGLRRDFLVEGDPERYATFWTVPLHASGGGRSARKPNDVGLAAPHRGAVAREWRSPRSDLDYRTVRMPGGVRAEVWWAGAFRGVRGHGRTSLDRLARADAEALAGSGAEALARADAFDRAFLGDVEAKRNGQADASTSRDAATLHRAATKPCPRCDADRPGIVVRHSNVLGGRCFRCGGSGRVAHNDGRLVHMTVWPSGMVTAQVTRDGVVGVVEHNNEVTYTCALSAVGEVDTATIDDDASAEVRRAIRAAADNAPRRLARTKRNGRAHARRAGRQ